MSVKCQKTIDLYASNVAEILNALDNLKEFVESLPAPDEYGELASPMHYGHVGTVRHIHDLIGQALQATEGFYKN